MDLQLKGKTVLVTGGSKGIGLGIAEAFEKEGARVAVAARGKEALDHVQQLHPEFLCLESDITNESQRTALIENVRKTFGELDILINNAGGSAGGETMETPLSSFKEAMELNYFSALHLAQLAASGMNEGSAIINISSIFGREAGGKPSYNSAKAAMISMTKSLGDELIKDGIRVNGVAPGSILHPSGNWQRRLDENPEKIHAFVEQEIPAGRFGTVEEIADVVVFLASPRAGWVSGATLNVDGGQSRSNF
ncbi:SDR family NAD(P)-dependent oxidoreductase [Alkalicoccus urumqiensis]|uniref:Short-chain dehydrogenase n=1 Tax=Alkalicoccus urumqiensis TaxID=1548213 RepID=A0A2P6MGT1_ALKUR|nr:SDR family oxidoreductase [Alkalicoccus urumqiensis]PRO65477.1 short-chain dehydrogenase [Alkalicoccus urumqiensis]